MTGLEIAGDVSMAFSSAPARNFGTDVFLALMRSPVRGLRTIRAGRTALSNAEQIREPPEHARPDRVLDVVGKQEAVEGDEGSIGIVGPRQGLDELALVHRLPFREPSLTVEPRLDVLSVEPVLDAGKTLFTIEQHFDVDTPPEALLFARTFDTP